MAATVNNEGSFRMTMIEFIVGVTNSVIFWMFASILVILLGKMVDCIEIQQNDSQLPSHIDNAAPSLTNPTVPLVSTTGTSHPPSDISVFVGN